MARNVVTVEAKGMKELEQNLLALKNDVAAKWVNGALRAGTRKILGQAKYNAMARNRTGLMVRTIRLGAGKKNNDGRREFFVVAGAKKGAAKGSDLYRNYYAKFQERGAKPHNITARGGGKLFFGGKYHSSVKHPGHEALRFLERAAQSMGQVAITEFGARLRVKLDRQGLLVPVNETE